MLGSGFGFGFGFGFGLGLELWLGLGSGLVAQLGARLLLCEHVELGELRLLSVIRVRATANRLGPGLTLGLGPGLGLGLRLG